jgi:hypothetical protein
MEDAEKSSQGSRIQRGVTRSADRKAISGASCRRAGAPGDYHGSSFRRFPSLSAETQLAEKHGPYAPFASPDPPSPRGGAPQVTDPANMPIWKGNCKLTTLMPTYLGPVQPPTGAERRKIVEVTARRNGREPRIGSRQQAERGAAQSRGGRDARIRSVSELFHSRRWVAGAGNRVTKYTVSSIPSRIPRRPLPHGRGSDPSRARKQAVWPYVSELPKPRTKS